MPVLILLSTVLTHRLAFLDVASSSSFHHHVCAYFASYAPLPTYLITCLFLFSSLLFLCFVFLILLPPHRLSINNYIILLLIYIYFASHAPLLPTPSRVLITPSLRCLHIYGTPTSTDSTVFFRMFPDLFFLLLVCLSRYIFCSLLLECIHYG